MHVSRALLLVYRELDVKLDLGGWRRRRFHHLATSEGIEEALASFRGFPDLVTQLTNGVARVEIDIVESDRLLTSLTRESSTRFWPSPADTEPEIDEVAPAGEYDSVFIFWPQHDYVGLTSVPSDAWGLALPPTAGSNGATYAAIANAPAAAWRGESRGEVWLHEWLHGVCGGYAQQGLAMPTRDADGAELHGYQRSATEGWVSYYRDLMNGNVLENGLRVGIPVEAWGTPYAWRNAEANSIHFAAD